MNVAVSCEGVRKTFVSGETAVHVLRGVDFRALQGEITFLVGPSGCGKTTLISVIAGLLDATSGKIEIFGKTLGNLDPETQIMFRRRHLGFVFQQYNLIPALTAAENASIPLLAAGFALKDAVGKARHVLARLGIGNKADHLPRTLSGGQQQRVALARAIVHEPKLIICDEPTAALDHESGEAVMELLSCSAVNPDRAVVVVTHDNRVFHFADRIAYMDDGIITRVESRSPISVDG
jgi:putative ABC transport system ATP-binding protein